MNNSGGPVPVPVDTRGCIKGNYFVFFSKSLSVSPPYMCSLAPRSITHCVYYTIILKEAQELEKKPILRHFDGHKAMIVK
jgi:hypothetical protein